MLDELQLRYVQWKQEEQKAQLEARKRTAAILEVQRFLAQNRETVVPYIRVIEYTKPPSVPPFSVADATASLILDHFLTSSALPPYVSSQDHEKITDLRKAMLRLVKDCFLYKRGPKPEQIQDFVNKFPWQFFGEGKMSNYKFMLCLPVWMEQVVKWHTND